MTLESDSYYYKKEKQKRIRFILLTSYQKIKKIHAMTILAHPLPLSNWSLVGLLVDAPH